jgi:hypothetical protein
MHLRTVIRAVATFALFSAGAAFGQLNSGQGADLNLKADVSESLTVTLDQSALTFALTAGSDANPGSTAVNVSVAWTLASGRSAVKLYAYFDSPNALINSTNSAYVIPSSAIWAAVGGMSVGTFSNSIPFGGVGVMISDTPISTNLVGSTSSAVTLNINLTALPSLQGGSYTGTLHFQAQATT